MVEIKKGGLKKDTQKHVHTQANRWTLQLVELRFMTWIATYQGPRIKH